MMHDIWEPELHTRINRFITRKAKEYPDLHLDESWDKYEHSQRSRNFARLTQKLKHA